MGDPPRNIPSRPAAGRTVPIVHFSAPARAIVPHLELVHAVDGGMRHGDPRWDTGLPTLDRVGKEVLEHLGNECGVAAHPRQLVNDKARPRGIRFLDFLDDIPDECAQGDGFGIQRHDTRAGKSPANDLSPNRRRRRSRRGQGGMTPRKGGFVVAVPGTRPSERCTMRGLNLAPIGHDSGRRQSATWRARSHAWSNDLAWSACAGRVTLASRHAGGESPSGKRGCSAPA